MTYKGVRLIDKLIVFYIRKIPNHPFKLRLISWFDNFIFNNAILLENTFGDKYFFSSQEFIGHEILFSGSYEPKSLKLCKHILKKGGNMLDIGANVGLFSIHLASQKNLNVYAVEPTATNFTRLTQNKNLNHLDNLHLNNIGLSDENSFSFLTNYSPSNSGTFRVVENNEFNSYLIKLATLSDLVKFHKITNIELLKIDVEGFEMKIFKGYFGMDDPKPENIVMEFTDLMERTGYTIADCYNFFKELGYNPYNIEGEEYELTSNNLPEANIWWRLEKS